MKPETELTLQLMMNYLLEHDYLETFLALEQQTQYRQQTYQSEIQFMRKIILKGQIQQAIGFINAIQNKMNPQELKKIYLTLYKQKLYQLIENPIQAQLKSLFSKELIRLCSEEEYQQFFILLTCKNVKQIPGMSKWTVIRGRLNCFQSILPALETVFANLSRSSVVPNLQKLQIIIKMYLEVQIESQKISQNSKLHEKKKTEFNSKNEQNVNVRTKQQIQDAIEEGQNINKLQLKVAEENHNLAKHEKDDKYGPYLQQSSSVVYDEQDKDNFTFLQNASQTNSHRILKLATINDSKAIRTCQFSLSGKYFAIGTNSSVVKIFEVGQMLRLNQPNEINPIYQIDGLHTKSIFCLNWSASEKALVTCSNDLNVKLTEFNNNLSQHRSSVIGKHDSSVRMVRFNSLQNRIISCGDDSLIKLWDIGKLKRCTNLKGHSASVSAFKMQQDGSDCLMYSVSKDSTIRKWDLRICECVSISKTQHSQLTYIANNTDRIVVSHKNGSISFFSLDLQLQHSLMVHSEQIRSVQALLGQQILLTASFDGHISLFTEKSADTPFYLQHNDTFDDKVVFATFVQQHSRLGFASTSTLGYCHIYSFQ